MTTRGSIRNRFARTRRNLRKTPAGCQQSLEALEDRTLLSVNFNPAVNYGAGSAPRSVAVGDFNGDGRPDLVTANHSSNTVSVLLGNGNGTFPGAVNYAVGSGPRSVAVADFNGDGKPDLAVGQLPARNTRERAAGQRQRHLPERRQLRHGHAAPTAVAVGDFNGDGKPDLAVANSTSANTVSVLLGNGNGTFQAAVSFATGSGPAVRGGGGLQRRRQARPGRRQPRQQHRQRAAGQRQRHLPDPPSASPPGARLAPWRWGTSTATASPTWSPPTSTATPSACCWATATAPSKRRQLRRRDRALLRGGGGLQRRRQARPGRRPTNAATPSACCWATATAPSKPPSASPRGAGLPLWRWGTSTATAGPTWPWPTKAATPSACC